MSTKQLDELVQLLKKEEVIELEEKKEKQESQQKSFVPPSETLHLESSQQKSTVPSSGHEAKVSDLIFLHDYSLITHVL